MAKDSAWRRLVLVFLISILSIGIIDISAAAEEQEFAWKVIGGEKLSSSASKEGSIFVYDGVPYVAYRDFDNEGKVTVKRYVDEKWEMVGSPFSPDVYSDYKKYDIPLVVDNGIVYVAYNDYDNEGIVTIGKYEDGKWESILFHKKNSPFIDICVYQGELYISCLDFEMGVWRYEGEGEWYLMGSRYWSSYVWDEISLCVDDGIAYLAYMDSKYDNKIVVQKCHGGKMDLVGGVPVSDDSGDDSSLDVDDGILYVGYQDILNNKASVKKFNGETWEYVGERWFSDYRGYSVQMDVNEGIPYIVCAGGLEVKKFQGGNWVDIGKYNRGGSYPSLNVYEGRPFIAHYSYGSGIEVVTINGIPKALEANLEVQEDQMKTGILKGTDIEGDRLTYSVVSQGAKGTVDITDSSTGAYKYLPNKDAIGADSFTFKVNDGTIDSEEATVSVTIENVNDKPVAEGGELSVTEEVEKTGTLSGSDIDSESLTYEIVKQGTKGMVEISDASTGAYKYLPNKDAIGPDSFTFKVNDGTLDSETATVSVMIANVNDKPVAEGGELSVTEEVEKTGTLSGSDIDSESLTYEIVKQGTKGTVEITDPKTGAYRYLPDKDAIGPDSFTFKVNDGTLDSETATVYVSIMNVNDKPTIEVKSPYEDKTLKDDETFTLKGNVEDNDKDKVSVTAIVYGSRKHQKSIFVDTKIDNAWSLSWNTTELEEGEYKDIIIIADDGNEGKGESVWKHTLKIDKKNPDLPELKLENRDGSKYSEGNWTNQKVDFTIKSSEEIERYEYKIGDGGWQNGQTGEIEKEGETKLYYKVWDKAGNASEEESATIKIDTESPHESELVINSNDKYSNEEFVTLKLNSEDELSGASKMMISNDSSFSEGFWEEYKEIKSWKLDGEEGKSMVYAKFMDEAGNITEKVSDDIILDTVAPEAEIETDNDGYTNKSIIMTLTAYDKDGSGLDRIKLPNNETIISMTTYKTVRQSVYGSVYETVYDKLHSGGPIAGGGYQLRYIAVENGEYDFIVEDNADNRKKITQTIGEIDATKPTGVITKSSKDWTNKDVNLTINAVDNGDSGIKGIRLPDGNFKKSATAEYAVMENGSYEFMVENNAGSRGRVGVTIDNIDTEAPSKPKISRLPDADYNYGFYKIDMIEGNDNLSGVERTMYRLSGAENSDWTEYDDGFEIQEIGITLIQAKTIDKAGNESEAEMMTVEVKRRKHTASDDKDENEQIINEPVVVEDEIVQLVEGGIDMVIELDSGKRGSVVLDTSAVKTLAENKRPLTIKGDGISIEFDLSSFETNEMQDIFKEDDSKIEIRAVALSDSKKNEIMQRSSIDDSGLHDMQREIFDVSTKISSKEEDRTIKDFNEPLAISIDMSDVELGEEEIGKLTGIRFEENEDGSIVPVKLGGVYDEQSKTFTFYTDQADKVSVVKADDLFEMDLTIDSREGVVNHEVKMNDVEPRIIDDRTMVPVRFIAESLGGKVNWIEGSKTIEIEYKGKILEMTVDQPIEGFDAKPVIMNDRTLVPLRYVSENLEAEVLWFPSDRKVKIIK